MAPKFGTSGLRGLVTELTDALVDNYTRAFLTACPTGGAVHLGWDLRESSPNIAACVQNALVAAGQTVIVHGAVPTPALALASMAAGQGAIMITGSHIPADRNGLKFYIPTGEIGKDDETAIIKARTNPAIDAPGGQVIQAGDTAITAYAERYIRAFGADALQGQHIGVYQHSSVARDVLCTVLQGLGAKVQPIGRSQTFVPVDTEAVDPVTRTQFIAWCDTYGLDALVSTDGDADRPMVCDATGTIVPGDVLGVLTASFIGARTVCTPVSSNSMVTDIFETVRKTRIGSPYVIAAMEDEADADGVVGFEANGGFLLGWNAKGPAGPLQALMTRDCLLPILAPLAAARASDQNLARLVATLPERFTAADRLQGIPSATSQSLIRALSSDSKARAQRFDMHGEETEVDTTDGLRMTFSSGVVIHLRPSGNAPELRCYAEARTPAAAQALVAQTLEMLHSGLS